MEGSENQSLLTSKCNFVWFPSRGRAVTDAMALLQLFVGPFGLQQGGKKALLWLKQSSHLFSAQLWDSVPCRICGKSSYLPPPVTNSDVDRNVSFRNSQMLLGVMN